MTNTDAPDIFFVFLFFSQIMYTILIYRKREHRDEFHG